MFLDRGIYLHLKIIFFKLQGDVFKIRFKKLIIEWVSAVIIFLFSQFLFRLFSMFYIHSQFSLGVKKHAF